MLWMTPGCRLYYQRNIQWQTGEAGVFYVD